MITINQVSPNVSLMKIGKAVDVDSAKLPQNSLTHIFDYGLRQILNDAMASGKTDAERESLALKRLDNLLSGTLRASGTREGDPIRKRALELAEGKIAAAPKFIAWLAEVKKTEADSLKVLKAKNEKLRELAKAAIAVEGNAFMKQAKIDVESAKGLDIDLDDIEI